MCCHRDSNRRSPACKTGPLTTTPWQPTLHRISPSCQELDTASLTVLIACLSLIFSIYLQVSCQPLGPHKLVNKHQG